MDFLWEGVDEGRSAHFVGLETVGKPITRGVRNRELMEPKQSLIGQMAKAVSP